MFSSGINNFKTAFDNFKPRVTNCLMLTVPFSLIFTILSIVIVGGTTMLGVGAAQQATTQDAAVAAVVGGVLLGMVILVIAISPFAAYFGFCFLRFTSQATANPSQTFSFGSLYAYHSSLWGFIGLALLQILIGFAAITAGGFLSAILFFLFGLPLFLIYAGWACFSACSYFSFFDAPETGVIKSLSRGWSLVSKDWRRWAAMAVLMIGAGVAIAVVNLLLGFTIGLIPVAGAFASMVISGLLSCYLAFVMCSCYRDSSASLK